MMRFVGLIFVLALFWGCEERELSGTSVGDMAPQISAKTIKGDVVALGDFVDKNKVLVFWMYGCAGCTDIIPALDKFESENSDKFAVLAINSYNVIEDLIKFQNENNFTNLKLLKDDLTITFDRFEIKYVPVIIVLDKDNKIIDKITGEMPWEKIKSRLLSLL